MTWHYHHMMVMWLSHGRHVTAELHCCCTHLSWVGEYDGDLPWYMSCQEQHTWTLSPEKPDFYMYVVRSDSTNFISHTYIHNTHTPWQSFPGPCHHTAHLLHCYSNGCTETAPPAAGSLAGTGLLLQESAQNEQTALWHHLQTDLAACTWVCIHEKIGTLWKPFSTNHGTFRHANFVGQNWQPEEQHSWWLMCHSCQKWTNEPKWVLGIDLEENIGVCESDMKLGIVSLWSA